MSRLRAGKCQASAGVPSGYSDQTTPAPGHLAPQRRRCGAGRSTSSPLPDHRDRRARRRPSSAPAWAAPSMPSARPDTTATPAAEGRDRARRPGRGRSGCSRGCPRWPPGFRRPRRDRRGGTGSTAGPGRSSNTRGVAGVADAAPRRRPASTWRCPAARPGRTRPACRPRPATDLPGRARGPRPAPGRGRRRPDRTAAQAACRARDGGPAGPAAGADPCRRARRGRWPRPRAAASRRGGGRRRQTSQALARHDRLGAQRSRRSPMWSAQRAEVLAGQVGERQRHPAHAVAGPGR